MDGGAGEKQTVTTLNKTLIHIVSLLTKYQVTDWFIGYGTLLGIVRNKSCIKNDDDIDIVINRTYFPVLQKLAKENNFKITLQKHIYFLRIEHPDYSPIDFYLAKSKEGVFIDTWENTRWTNVYPLIQQKWKGVILQLPQQYLKNLKNRYGRTWRTPKKSKGIRSTSRKQPSFI